MKAVRRSCKKNSGRRLGFTLMEVLLVLAILGVMMAVVLPNLMTTQKSAYIKNTKVQIHAIEEAADFYALDHDGSYPPSIETLVVSQGNDPKWKGPYLKSSSQSPADSWGSPIQYAYPGQNDPNRPDISSMGPDRQPNTADDITNFTTTP